MVSQPEEQGPPPMVERPVVVEGASSGFKNQIDIGPHRLMADEPVAVGGTDQGPGPYELLCAALGACTSMTVSMYARRKGWPLASVRVQLRHGKVHAEDCAECESKKGMVDVIERDIQLVGELSDEQRQRLLEMAGKCPVARTLTSEIRIHSRLV